MLQLEEENQQRDTRRGDEREKKTTPNQKAKTKQREKEPWNKGGLPTP